MSTKAQWPPSDPPSAGHPHLFEDLVHLHHGLSREFARRLGLPLPRLALLHELAHAGARGGSVNDLARELGVTPALITRQVQELTAARLVRRRPDARDRRRNWAVLTEKGMKFVVELHLRAHALEAELTAGLDPADLAAAGRVLAVLARRVEPGRRRDRSTVFEKGDKP